MALTTVSCPLPGTFYRRPSPDQPPFQEIGAAVKPGDTIGLVEVMKSFIPVEAEAGGTIVAFHVDNEEPVMAGQPLYDLET